MKSGNSRWFLGGGIWKNLDKGLIDLLIHFHKLCLLRSQYRQNNHAGLCVHAMGCRPAKVRDSVIRHTGSAINTHEKNLTFLGLTARAAKALSHGHTSKASIAKCHRHVCGKRLFDCRTEAKVSDAAFRIY